MSRYAARRHALVANHSLPCAQSRAASSTSSVCPVADGSTPEWVKQYRLIQEREDRILFTFVPTERATPERLAAFLDHAWRAVGPQVEVEAQRVVALEPGPGGKFRPAQSLLPGEHRAPDWNATVDRG